MGRPPVPGAPGGARAPRGARAGGAGGAGHRGCLHRPGNINSGRRADRRRRQRRRQRHGPPVGAEVTLPGAAAAAVPRRAGAPRSPARRQQLRAPRAEPDGAGRGAPPGCRSVPGVAAGAMTGVEAEQEFDFDFLFEFKHSDEGGGGSRRGARGCWRRDAAGSLLALPRSGGRKAASLRGERGGGAGSPGRTGQPGPGRRLSPQPRREAASGTGSCPGGRRSSGSSRARCEGRRPGGRRGRVFRSLKLFEMSRPPRSPLARLPPLALGLDCQAENSLQPLSPSPREPELGSGFSLKVIRK